MTKQAFNVEGDFQMGRIRQHFELEVVGEDEAAAKEYAYTDIGSRHGVARRQIQITAVKPLDLEKADHITKKRVTG